MSLHGARIAFLHSIKATGGVSATAVKDLVFDLSRKGHVGDAMRVIRRYKLPDPTDTVLEGIRHGQSGGVPRLLISQLDNLADNQVKQLLEIFSIKGIHPLNEFVPKFIPLVKQAIEKDPACIPSAIASLRRIKSERKFLWRMYTSSTCSQDDQKLTQHICQIAGINGWGADRVNLILSRRSGDLENHSAAMLVKALSHYPGQGSLEDILRATDGETRKEPLFSSVIGYYAINGKFSDLDDLLRSVPTETLSVPIFESVLRYSDEGDFFRFFSFMKDEVGLEPSPGMVRRGIDLAIECQSAKRLVQMVQAAHVGSIPLDECQVARLESLTNSFKVPVRVRRRVRELLKLIDSS
jgi:hypothetical protein